MILRKQIGWTVAMAYVLSGRRAAVCRRCRRAGLIVPVLFHGPSPQKFEAILRALDRLVGLNRVEVTFDDGRKILRQCVPVLEKFGVRATFFVSPGEILRGYNWAERAKRIRTNASFGDLCRMSEAERVAAVDPLGRGADADELLSVEDIRALAGHPLVEFGNHTWSHMSCANRPVDEVMDEIGRTQRQLAEWTGRTPTKFSYPFGHDSTELDAAICARGLVPYCLRPGLVTAETLGRARNMAYEDLTVLENAGRLLTAWPKVKRMPL